MWAVHKSIKNKSLFLLVVIENGFNETQAHENAALFQTLNSCKRNWHLRNCDASGRLMQHLEGAENNQSKLSTSI